MRIKIVRDKYKEIIPAEQLSVLSDEEAQNYLFAKIAEEANEMKDSNFKDIDEYADVFEVLIAIAKLNGFNKADILKARNKKNREKGSFDEKLLWREV